MSSTMSQSQQRTYEPQLDIEPEFPRPPSPYDSSPRSMFDTSPPRRFRRLRARNDLGWSMRDHLRFVAQLEKLLPPEEKATPPAPEPDPFLEPLLAAIHQKEDKVEEVEEDPASGQGVSEERPYPILVAMFLVLAGILGFLLYILATELAFPALVSGWDRTQAAVRSGWDRTRAVVGPRLDACGAWFGRSVYEPLARFIPQFCLAVLLVVGYYGALLGFVFGIVPFLGLLSIPSITTWWIWRAWRMAISWVFGWEDKPWWGERTGRGRARTRGWDYPRLDWLANENW